MPHYRIECGGCGAAWDVDASDERDRCPSCGVEHEGPWQDPTVLSIELVEANGYTVTRPRVLMEPARSRGGRA